MSFDLPDAWVWDYWFADDGERYHLFFLYASRALLDPDARHHRASIGHAVSEDLEHWTRVADALVRSDAPAFDDLATWTGSVVRHPDGSWVMFYTGATLADDGMTRQRIGFATSRDLSTWRKHGHPLFEPDPRWYAAPATDDWHDDTFRDPWVIADPDGDGWHLLFTARAPDGPRLGRGVVGHARSRDLVEWTLYPPLTRPSERGFGQLEVPQSVVVDGRPVLLFSCNPVHASPAHAGERGGTWVAPAESVVSGFDIERAYPITLEGEYVARLIQRRSDGQWLLFAFRDATATVPFRGGIIGPRRVAWREGRLVLADAAAE